MVGEPDHDDRLNEGYQKEQVVSPLTTCKGNTVRIDGNGKHEEKMLFKHINPLRRLCHIWHIHEMRTGYTWMRHGETRNHKLLLYI